MSISHVFMVLRGCHRASNSCFAEMGIETMSHHQCSPLRQRSKHGQNVVNFMVLRGFEMVLTWGTYPTLAEDGIKTRPPPRSNHLPTKVKTWSKCVILAVFHGFEMVLTRPRNMVMAEDGLETVSQPSNDHQMSFPRPLT